MSSNITCAAPFALLAVWPCFTLVWPGRAAKERVDQRLNQMRRALRSAQKASHTCNVRDTGAARKDARTVTNYCNRI